MTTMRSPTTGSGAAAGPPVREVPPRAPRRRRRGRALPYLLIAPAVVLELLVHVGPMLLGVWISLLQLTQLTVRRWTGAPFAGLENYRTGLDPDGAIGSALLASGWRTLVFTVLVVGVAWAVGLFAAVLLSSEFRGRALFRTFFLVPFALPAFVTIIGWSFIFNQQDGALNRLLVDDLGVLEDKPFWLIGDNAFVVVVVVAAWRLWPFAFLMLLAALQNVPHELHEAAALDGASAWQRFRHITMPAIGPANGVVVLVMSLWTVNEFTVPYVLFGPSPPESAQLLSTLVYGNAFVNFNFGLGAAMSVLLLVVLLLASIGYVLLVLPEEDRRG
jgi:multiple sugar transport system permease protein